jgi:hypothetical protein
VTDEATILDELLELVDQNGNIPRDTKDRMTLRALAEVIRQLKSMNKLEKRVSALEEQNLIGIYAKHPKMATAILFAVFVILNYAAHAITPDQWFSALARALGVGP